VKLRELRVSYVDRRNCHFHEPSSTTKLLVKVPAPSVHVIPGEQPGDGNNPGTDGKIPFSTALLGEMRGRREVTVAIAVIAGK
jgi:hypothetical protein